MTITFEYLPYLGRSVYIQLEHRVLTEHKMAGEVRTLVWDVYSYADDNTGPWITFRWIPYGLPVAAGL